MKKKLKEAIIILAAFVIITLTAVTSMSQKSLTNDEIAHITAGYSYVKSFDYRLNNEHPPLVKLLSGFSLALFVKPNIYFQDEWDNEERINAGQWKYSKRFFFEYNDNADEILFFARLPIILLTLLLGYYVFRWAKELYGFRAGMLALFLYSFSPNILAHARLVTTDLAIVCFSFITAYYLWCYMRGKRRIDMALTGLFLGFALASKFTGIYLLGILPLLALVYLYFDIKGDKKLSIMKFFLLKKTWRQISRLFIPFLIIFLIGFMVLFATYGFSEAGVYFEGLKSVARHSIQGHHAFLLGMHSKDGWWYYFIVAFLLKTPISAMALLALSLLYLKRSRPNLSSEAFLIIPIAVFFILFMFIKINIGLRHILMIYPFIFVFTSKVMNIHEKKNFFRLLIVGVLCLWYVLSSLMIYPHYLAYFNEMAGGPNNGWKYLTDSNIDWGQDLKGLAQYLKDNDIDEKINLAYFGSDIPEYRGIEHKTFMCHPIGGISAVSVTFLQGITEKVAECYSWIKEYVPVAKIGYSIFIYDLSFSENDVDKARLEFCRQGCVESCNDVNMTYVRSGVLNESCDCECRP